MQSDAAGSLYVTWDGNGTDGILTTKLNADGSFAWDPFYRDVSDYESSQSGSYSILAGDKLYAVWNDNRNSAENIYVQKLDTSGVIEWNPDGVQASDLPYYIPNPKLVTSDSESVVAVYEVNAGLYAQKFRPDSTIKFDINGEPISTATTPFYEDYELLQGNGGCTVAFWSTDAGDIYAGRICSPVTNVGVYEVTSDANSISVFPNPSLSGIFQVNISKPNSDLKVYDLFGRVLLSEKISSAISAIDLSSLPKGSYLLQASNGNETATQKLLIE